MDSLLNTHKALIITVLLSSFVVLLGFNVHIKKQNPYDAETYFEILPEDIEELEQEDLADLIKSLDDVMATNRAQNENQKDALEDEDFQNTLDKIRNRNSMDELLDNSGESSNNSDSPSEDIDSFDEINSIISKRSEKKRKALLNNTSSNKKSSVSYSLVNRTHEYLPPPIYLCEQGGKIVINIEVDHKGNVISTLVNSSSTSNNGCLIDHAIEYAKAAKFSRDSSKAKQLGTITFIFQGKS